MRKFRVKKTGEPIEIGQTLRRIVKKEFSFGSYESVREDLITEKNVDSFVKDGILEEINTNTAKEKPYSMDINHYVKSIAKRLNFEVNTTYEYLDMMNRGGYKQAVLNMLLKEISIELNRSAESYGNEVWLIDAETGGTFPIKARVPRKNTNSFNNRELAEDAKRICATQLMFMGIK